jgi:hypothetical protein
MQCCAEVVGRVTVARRWGPGREGTSRKEVQWKCYAVCGPQQRRGQLHTLSHCHIHGCVLFFSVALQHTPYVTCVWWNITASAVSAPPVPRLSVPNLTAIWLQFGSNLTWGARDPRPRHRNMVVFCRQQRKSACLGCRTPTLPVSTEIILGFFN